jgi:hypothetical protein
MFAARVCVKKRTDDGGRQTRQTRAVRAHLALRLRCAALPFKISNIFGFADMRTLDIFVRVLGAYFKADARGKQRQRAPAFSIKAKLMAATGKGLTF